MIVRRGDAELYEGSNWEAMVTAAHLGLGNLVCIVDRNGQGTIGHTDRRDRASDGPALEPLRDKWAAFGFEVRECDGHDYDSIADALGDARHRDAAGPPLCLISKTVKGHGSAAVADKKLWHYRVPGGEDLERVRADLGVVPTAGPDKDAAEGY